MLPMISQKVYNITAGVSILPTISIAVIYDPCFLCKCQICKIPFRFLQKDGVSGVDIFMISLSFAVI